MSLPPRRYGWALHVAEHALGGPRAASVALPISPADTVRPDGSFGYDLPMGEPATGLRLAELLAPLSLVMDLGRGQPPAESMQACLLAVALAKSLGLADAEIGTVYYASLLR